MKRSKFTKGLALVLSLLMLLSLPMTSMAVTGEFKVPDGMYLVSSTQRRIAPGVTENRIVTNKTSGNEQVMGYAVTVDMSKGSTATLMASYADYDGSKWKMQTVRQQAAQLEKKTGANVVAAFNADIYNMATGEPTNSLVMGGKIYKAGLGTPYFAILKDGTPKIGSSMTQEVLNNCRESLGGFYTLVENGVKTANGYSTGNFAPKTAIGIKADGNVVVYNADGRNYPVSVGLNDRDLADIMIGLGCVDVLNFDGGGSATYAAKYEGSESLEVANVPSDGTERQVSSALMIVSSAKPTGVFDHASISPADEIYTPGSTVQFTAIGVDTSGGKADLPADGKFVLDTSSLAKGSITDDGLFTANSTEGTVKVNYVSGGKVCGSTEIEIYAPDSIYFESEEVSLGFEKQSDLGLTVKYKERNVNYKDGDIVWTMDDSRMGSFTDNIFTSSDSETITGKIYAASAFDSAVSASITAIIGKLPSIMWDFEVPEDYRFSGSALTPDVENPNMVIKNYGRGVVGDAEIITKENGEVRHGTRALKISYDLANWNLVTDGICIGPMADGAEIEGSPTGIGMWVYAPEGTPNFWLRMYYKDASNAMQVCDITVQRKEATDGIGGINWQGWKYVEGQLKGTAPYKFMSGMTIRLMALSPAGNEHGLWTVTGGYEKDADGNDTEILNKKWINKTEAHGAIYVDNVQFVYGANVDDVDNPVIDNVQIGTNQSDLKDITSGTVVESNDVLIQSSFHDVENKYTTDINFDNVNVYLDGKDVTADSIILKGDYMIKYYGTLADGVHSVKVLVRDGFNNETTETRYFTVKGGVEYPTVQVSADTPDCKLNKDFSIALTSNRIDAITGVKAKIRLDNTIVADASDLDIVYAPGFDGSYTYNAANGYLQIEITGSAAKAKSSEGTIATITAKIPFNTLEGKKFSYRVLEGEITFSDPSITTTTFASANIAVPIEADYVVSSDEIIVGDASVKLYVKNADGTPAAGVDVFNSADDSLVGTTDENGEISTAAFNQSVQKISVYAMKDGAYSFKYATQSAKAACAEDGTPEHILVNASENGAKAKNISWLSNPLATGEDSLIQVALKSDYELNGEAAFTQKTGTNKLYSFMGNSNIEENYIVRINTVKLTGLKGDSEYVFRVGDGNVWSAVKSFSTALAGGDTNFFVFGDIQATDTTNIANLMKAVSADGIDYDFGIQTGDSIETASIYSHWDDILEVFSDDNISDIDLLHVLGNHEFMGDANGDSSVAIYNLQNKDFYSVDYGNVHVAVINYAAIESNLDAALKWLVEDSKASDAAWKIVTMHVPPYNTNSGDSHKAFTEKFPKAAQEAGIDFVFSGHDHSYARTAPMTDLKVDTENGITYFICGSSGEKSYSVTVDPSFNFEIANNDYTSIYLSVSATDSTFTVNTYDVDGDNIVLYDSYTKEKKSDCTENGHSFAYDGGYLECTKCHYVRALGTYTGFATDVATGRTMYFIGGEAKTGWYAFGNDMYYFDENGLAVTGSQTINGISGYEFSQDGKQIGAVFVTDENGITRAYRGGAYIKGWYQLNGDWYYFSRANGEMRTGETTITYRTNQKLDVIFSEDGKLLRGGFYSNEDGTIYYWGPEPVTGWQVIDGEKYYFSPEDFYMATDDTEIDGKMYAFDMNGVLQHEGTHSWTTYLKIIDANCTVDGKKVDVCDECGALKTVVTPATGHIDLDGDGECDTCACSVDFNSGLDNFIYSLFNRIKNLLNAIMMLIAKNKEVISSIIPK